jgi:hypothetical protein
VSSRRPGAFDSELSIQAAGPTTWKLLAPLIWTGTQGDTYRVPLGFVTDFASVPRFLHWLVLPYGPYTRAAVLHDYLIEERINHPDERMRVTSRDTDGVFRRVMADLGTPWGKRWTMWAAVRAASLGNPRRAYGRQFARDAPAVAGIAVLALPVILPGVAGVLISLGIVRLLTIDTQDTRKDITMANTADGSKTLFNDSRLGILAGFVATQIAMGIVEWIGTIDFSTWPTWLATTGALLAGFAVNAITAWAAKRGGNRPGTARHGVADSPLA